MAYTIETLPSGAKRIRVNYTDEFGNYKRKSVTGRTEKEVLQKALQFEKEVKHTDTADGITVERALEDYINLNRFALSPTTISQYESMLRNRFESIKKIEVDRLTDRLVQNWINGMIQQGLSPKSIKNTYAFFLPAIQKYTSFAPRISLPQSVSFVHEYPQDYEVAQIVSAAEGTPLELPVLLAAFGGMRMSEILGLKWSDIKEDHIVVQRAKVYVDGEEIEKTTKSEAGTRYLPLFAPIRAAINRTEKDGEYLINRTARSVKKRYETLLKSLGLPPYRFHDLRHHAASVGAKLGIPDDYMRQYIGHSTVNMLKKYQHQMESATSKYAKELDNYYSAAEQSGKKKNPPESDS